MTAWAYATDAVLPDVAALERMYNTAAGPVCPASRPASSNDGYRNSCTFVAVQCGVINAVMASSVSTPKARNAVARGTETDRLSLRLFCCTSNVSVTADFGLIDKMVLRMPGCRTVASHATWTARASLSAILTSTGRS